MTQPNTTIVDFREREFSTTVCLVRAAQSGDDQAVDALFSRYLPRVRQIVALRMGWGLRRFLEIDDVTQDVFLKVFRNLGRFQHHSEGSFRNWMAHCVECEIIDQARKIKAKKNGGIRVQRFYSTDSLHVSIFRDQGPTPCQIFKAKELEEKIERALLNIPKHYREVIIMRQLCGMSYREMAKAMGFGKEATVRKACSRALRKLREMIESEP